MDILSPKLFPEIVIEDPLPHMYQHHQMMNPFDFPLDDFDFNLFSSEMHYPCAPFVPETTRGIVDPLAEAAPTIMERPMKTPKTKIWSKTCSPKTYEASRRVMSSPSSNTQLISFGSLDLSPTESQQLYGSYEIQDCQKEMKRAGAMSRPTLHTQEHVIAERKRRQKLSQSFIALSAIIPGLKKMDKASILGDAIKYMKQLQERIKKLEEEVAIKNKKSVVFVKKSQVSADNDMSLNQNFYNQFEQQLPEIEARVLDRNVLFRIHHEKRKGYTTEILSEIEKLKLSVLNSSVLPFGSSMLDMTIVAQMDVGFCMKAEDLVKNLRQAILRIA
ncbi:transcription factor NAI1-like [Rhodamnia argentea]|uniref:Transcription factor NAI1-like n=1 Tax=Rhodamnia argentea TaxID=178133 RepID=A0A8B8QQC2_9MYRT|nr:transcription factor NAI1-like [Rhodamnia argentea]